MSKIKYSAIEHWTNTLQTELQRIVHSDAISANSERRARELLGAIDNGALENDEPTHEAIMDISGNVLYHESLSVPIDNLGNQYPIYPFVNSLYDIEEHQIADLYICTTALLRAKEQNCGPIGLNISSESLLNRNFCNSLEKIVELLEFDPEEIVIENLERFVPRNADITHLRELKDKGYKFALDDLSHEDLDCYDPKKCRNRLYVLGELVENTSDDPKKNNKGYIKFDGPLIRGYLVKHGFFDGRVEKQEDGLEEIITELEKHYGTGDDAPIRLAEWVHDWKEAQFLHDTLGITAFQSQYLGKKPFDLHITRHTETAPPEKPRVLIPEPA